MRMSQTSESLVYHVSTCTNHLDLSSGDHPPSSVYRLIKEAYDDEDYEL
jgi:hypothetical protein